MFVKNYKWNGFKMPLNKKNINKFYPVKKNGSVDVTFARAITHQKHLKQSGRSLGAVRGVQWTFSIHSAYLLKSQSENKKFSWSVWIIGNLRVLFCDKSEELSYH